MRKKTIAAFDGWKADPRSWSELLQRVAEGETLREVCASKALPYSLVARHIASTPAVKAEYDAALQIWGDSLAQETVGIVDGATPETAGLAKLKSETRFRLAGKLDRERYGEQPRAAVVMNISLGDVAREIAELEQRLGLAAKPPVLTIPAPVGEVVEGEII